MADETETNVTVIVDPESGVDDLGGGESEGENTGENTAEISDAVAIAEIEANKEITIAAIHAENEAARIEAETERQISWAEHESETAALQASMTELNREAEELRLRVAELESQLNPMPLSEQEEAAPVLEIETVPEMSLTPPSTAESETVTEPGPSAEEEKPGLEIAAVVAIPGRKRRRLI